MNLDSVPKYRNRHTSLAFFVILALVPSLVLEADLSFGQNVGPSPKEAMEKDAPNSGVQTSEFVGFDVAYCHCRKMRFLGHGGMKVCKDRFGNLSEDQETQMTRQCRTAPVQDPLADALLECSTYEDRFMHPFGGEPMTTKVSKDTEGECHFIEDVPGGFVMTCVWPSSRWKEMSEYYRHAEFFLADVKIKSQTHFENGEPVTETTYTVDGKPWHNPLQASLSDGTCQVTRKPTSKDGVEKK